MNLISTNKNLSSTNDYICIQTSEAQSIGIKVEGTFTGTLAFTGQVDSAEQGGPAVVVTNSTGVEVSSITAAGSFIFTCNGHSVFTIYFSSYTSGMAAIKLTPTKSSSSSSSAGGGDASAAKQDTGNGYLLSLDNKTPALASGKVPVVITSLPLPSGAATETTLSNIKERLPEFLINDRIAVDAVTQTFHDSVNLNTAGSIVEGVGRVTISGEAAQMLSLYFDFGGATGATVTAHGSLDGGLTYLPTNLGLQKFGQGSVSTAVTSITATQSLETNFVNYTHIQLTLDAISTGSVVIKWFTTAANKIVKIPALGDQADTVLTDSSQTGSAIQFLKGLASLLATSNVNTATQPYKVVIGQTNVTVSSAAASALPGGAGGNLLDATAAGLWTDVRGFGGIQLGITTSSGISAGVLTFETADDASGTNFRTMYVTFFGQTLVAGLGTTLTLVASSKYSIMVAANSAYIRIRVSTTISGGTASVSLYASAANTIPYTYTTQGGTWNVGGGGAHAATISGNPLRQGFRGVTANPTAVTTGQTVDGVATLVGAQIVKLYSIPEADWVCAAASGGITNTTTAVTIAAAAGSGLRNYITAIQISATALGVATELAIRDDAGGTVLWRHTLSTTALAPMSFVLPTPLKSTANKLLEVVTLTASVTGAVYFNAQGYIAP